MNLGWKAPNCKQDNSNGHLRRLDVCHAGDPAHPVRFSPYQTMFSGKTSTAQHTESAR
jgi:hypothetical protein